MLGMPTPYACTGNMTTEKIRRLDMPIGHMFVRTLSSRDIWETEGYIGHDIKLNVISLNLLK